MTNSTRIALLTTSLLALGACSQQAPAPSVDDALRNDLALAATVRAPAPQQFVGPAELGQYPAGYPAGYAPQPYGQAYAPQPQYVVAAPAPAPRPAATVRRTAGASRSSGTVYQAPAPQRERVIKNTKRDAAIGAVTGAAIGVAASSKKDRLKGGIIGAVAGGVLGGVIGNNVDVKRIPF